MTSGNTLPFKLTKIDELTRSDHYYLDESDVCYCLGEYTARGGYGYSETNNLISNFKKGMDKKGSSEWYWKEKAIERVGAMFRNCIKNEALEESLTLVPIPPSKAKSNPLYDDRMRKALDVMCRGLVNVDLRELVLQTQTTEASHELEMGERRLDPGQRAALYEIDEDIIPPDARSAIIVFDDLLTTGASFKAMKSVLTERFPESGVMGMFIARRALNTDEFEEIF